MSPAAWIGVALLGALGALARFHVDTIVQRISRSSFPLGTLAINLSGALGLGVLTGSAVGGTSLVLIGSAGIGSFTTFSTWMFESERLAEDGEFGLALTNILVSLLVGVAAAAIGWQIGGVL